ncbi:hypothetical protein R6Q59_012207 [Mikania micrantha]
MAELKGGGGVVGGGKTRSFSVLPAATADGDVTESAAVGPVPAAGFAEMTRLGEVIVVVVAEFGVGGVAARAWKVFWLRRWRTGGGVVGLCGGCSALVAGFRWHFEVWVRLGLVLECWLIVVGFMEADEREMSRLFQSRGGTGQC